MALLYEEGQGVPQNSEIARDLYQQATAKGSAVAELNLGLLYCMKRVCADPEENKKLAEFHIYRAATRHKLPQALFVMGKLCLENRRDHTIKEAIDYFKLAAEHGDKNHAVEQLERIFLLCMDKEVLCT